MENVKLVICLLMVTLALTLAEIETSKNAFRVYRQIQRTTQKNHIKLRFKTIHSTGLIMFAQGANKRDYLSLELFRGKIRVSGNFANGTANALRPIMGQFDMFAGKDLADNLWHTVEYIRNIRQNIIYVDRGTSNEKFIFRKSPETYDELSVSLVTFGGYYSFSTSDLSTAQSYSRKGISACFSEVTFSQEWFPLQERSYKPEPKTINFLESTLPDSTPSTDTNKLPPERMTDIGDIKTVLECTDTDPSYRPLFFKSAVVNIGLIQNYTIPKLKMDLKFRTVVNDQTLANFTHLRTGETIELRVNRKGQVVLQFDQDTRVKVIETAREDYHDNQWHEASFDIDNEESAEKSYTAKFTVDGKTRYTKLNKRIPFDGYINIGFGFTGCMRDIKINDEEIQRVRRSLTDTSATPKFFNISDVGVAYNVCSIRDFCNPNPCQNGGKCNQTDDNFVCNCDGTLYEGSTCHRPRFNYTCAGVRKSGERRSDVYYIDFDGMGPMTPVEALCDLGDTIETTVTQINNTKREDQDVTTQSGFNKVDINYQASITQMRELIMNSASCKQFIKFKCKGSPIFNSPTGPPYVSWMGGDDVAHFYWGGALDNRGYCSCGVKSDCRVGGRLTGQYCNCDSLSKFQDVEDEGNFTIKEHLPVRAVNFMGKVLKNSVTALLRVGHLRCQGFGSHEIAATFRKPYSYLSVFHPDQPFDNVQAGEISFDFKTSEAYNYMTVAHAIGPFSGDYIKIMIWSKTMMRVHLNLGFGDLKQDVDISRTGRTLDDNEWHEFSVMFNPKEMNVTLDGVRMIQGLPLQAEPVFFNVDATPVYIGGSYHDIFGFVGCIRSLYVNGRIFDISNLAVGKENEGIYSGCGSACPLLNRPCNYGECMDQYDSFKCNCSVSPFGGKFCQNETRPMTFGGGSYISYNMVNVNHTRPLATAKIVIGFKTTTPNVGLAQLEGNHSRHFSLALIDGYATLFWNLKIKKEDGSSGTLEETATEVIQITKRRLNNDRHNVIKVIISSRQIKISVPNYGLSASGNVTEVPVFNERGDIIGMELQEFERPTKVTIGRLKDIKMNVGSINLPLTYQGCMSGAKMVYTPHRSKKDPFPESRELDFFKMMEEYQSGGGSSNNQEQPLLEGSFPSSTGEAGCGADLPTPGELPTVGPAKQFFTKSPGLDNSVRIEETDWVNQMMLVACIIILTALILGFLYVLYSKAAKNYQEYERIHRAQKPHAAQPMKKMQAMASGQQQQPSYEKQNLLNVTEEPEDQSGGGDGMYL